MMQMWDEMIGMAARGEGWTPDALRAQDIDAFLVTMSNFEKHTREKIKHGRNKS